MKVCVIGGGASGMLASLLIARKGHNVTLLEKNEKLGKKLYITGKGRCNLTNAVTGNDFLANVVRNQKFIMSAEVRFNSSDTMELFESLGVSLKIERGNRVFPESDKASDITKALEKGLKAHKVDVRLNCCVEGIVVKDSAVKAVKVNGELIECDACVVATGGISYKLTGSTGDGYEFAKALGHTIIEPKPALVSIGIKNHNKNLSGLSLKNVVVFAKQNEKVLYQSQIGEMLFTGSGISGPLVLTLSSYINRISAKNLKICIDFKPALSDFALFQRIERDIIALKSKQFSSLLEGLLPKSLVDDFCKKLKISRDKKVSQLTGEERKSLVYYLKNFDLDFADFDDIDRAVVTSGGVNVKEIKPKSMESKIVQKLYFIGEVLDVDALTGGFNLQIAFSTAASCASDF